MMAIPSIDMEATGRNITRLRQQAGLTVRDLQEIFGFTTPQAIYKWQHGTAMPAIDNLVVLAAVLNVSIDEIVIVGFSFGRGMARHLSGICASCFYIEHSFDNKRMRNDNIELAQFKAYKPFRNGKGHSRQHRSYGNSARRIFDFEKYIFFVSVFRSVGTWRRSDRYGT